MICITFQLWFKIKKSLWSLKNYNLDLKKNTHIYAPFIYCLSAFKSNTQVFWNTFLLQSLFSSSTTTTKLLKSIFKNKANQQLLLLFLWSVRLTIYLLYREYILWYPQLHNKMTEMNQRANFYQSKFSLWLCVSLYCILLCLPCFSTMIQQK